jgi:hypothetical protein
MGRFFFDLEGKHSAIDPAGLPFESELDAFRSAQMLAVEIGSIRPHLRGNTWVAIMSRKRDGDAYYVSV